jgi:nucleoside-diphosphate-sugar epimerase
MKIFITGTTGFLGMSLKEHFETAHTVSEYARGTNITSALMVKQPDLIIHCAGEIYNADKMFATNVGIVEEILEWVKRNPAVRLIQIGSSAEYGPMHRATSEVDPINPVDVYQATKGAATLLCQGYARQFGLQTLVARIYSGYGPYERPHRLFPRLYRAFFHNEPMKLFGGVHDFIYIDDFVRGIDMLTQTPWPAGEIVNFGSGRQYTNRAVLETWERVTGRTAPVEYEDRLTKAYESDVWVCDTAYARMQYKFQTEYSLEDGIKDFIKKMQNVKTN